MKLFFSHPVTGALKPETSGAQSTFTSVTNLGPDWCFKGIFHLSGKGGVVSMWKVPWNMEEVAFLQMMGSSTTSTMKQCTLSLPLVNTPSKTKEDLKTFGQLGSTSFPEPISQEPICKIIFPSSLEMGKAVFFILNYGVTSNLLWNRSKKQ